MVVIEDLGEVLIFAVAFGLAALAYYVSKAIAHGVSFLPFGIGSDIAGAIEGALVTPLKGIMDGSSAGIAKGLMAVADALAVFLGLTLLLGLGVKAGFEYLWHVALRPLIHTIVDPVLAIANKALGKVEEVPGLVAREVGKAEAWATREAERVGAVVRAEATSLARDAEHAAERYADQAVADLRTIEDAAISSAARLAHEGIVAAQAAAARALTEGEAFASREVAQAEALANTAVADLRDITNGLGGDLTQLQDYIGKLGLPAVIAAVPALAVLVHTIAAETGLDNAACRSKVKGICGTDPAAWANLLAGLAAVGFAFNLKELAHVAEELVPPLAKVIAKAA